MYCEVGEELKEAAQETMVSPSLEVFKATLDGALNNLVKCKESLPMAGYWNKMICKAPSSPNHSMTQ